MEEAKQTDVHEVFASRRGIFSHSQKETLKAQLGAELPWFQALNEARQAALLSMAYQMGLVGLRKWQRTLGHLASGDYESAATEMVKSRWYTQTRDRARRTCYMMRYGRFPEPW